MYLMEREIRMVGFDPTGGAGAGIEPVSKNSIRIRTDFTDDSGTGGPDGDTGDIGEDIIYALSDVDTDGDTDLVRNDVNGTGIEMLAENIDAVDFVYLDKNGGGTTNASEIRSVQISLVARSNRPDRGYHDTTVYRNQAGEEIYEPSSSDQSDQYRRRMLSAEVMCRNLGLE